MYVDASPNLSCGPDKDQCSAVPIRGALSRWTAVLLFFGAGLLFCGCGVTAGIGAGEGAGATSQNKTTPNISWATPAPITYGTALSTAQLNATASVAGTFAYSPAAGTVPPVGTDKLTVTFTPTDTADYNSATASVSLVVQAAQSKTTPKISWATPAPIPYGTALSATQLNATASVAGTFAYSPAAGTVPPVGTDTLSVTFTPSDIADYNSATASVSLVVQAAQAKTTPTISWATPAPIPYGTLLSSTQLNATASVPGTFAYSPPAGTLLPVGTSKLSVTFTPSDTADYSSAKASVSLLVQAATRTNKTTPTITWPTPAPIPYGTALSSTQLDATASVPGTFVYFPAAGTVPPAGTTKLSVTFTPSDITEYNSVTANVSLVVQAASKETPTLTWRTPDSITYGTALSATQLDATASAPGTFAYSPAVGTVLAVGDYTLSVTFTPTDTTKYNSATASVLLVVNAAATKTTPTIAWPTPAPISYGTALSATQLDATASVPGTFAYSPGAGAVPSVGTDTLSVTFTPSNTTAYNTATASVSLVVNSASKTTPTITWPTPAAITYGTALSATQLDATASVPGTFAYTPAAGTVPPAGTDTLSVTFTPTDTTTYNSATASVSLVVNAAVGVLSKISCASSSMSVAGIDACTITLTAAAGGGGLTISLASNSSAVTVPASVTVPAGSSSAGFAATVSTVTTAQTATLTATAGGVTVSYVLQLSVATQGAALTLQSTSVAFGTVALNTPATQMVTLTSSGTAPVTISAGAVTGTGFSISGVSFPVTLNPGQTATLAIQFDPTSAGAVRGTVTLTDNTSAGTAAIALSGTGQSPPYEVNLSWTTPSSAADPVVGYNIYRSTGGNSYQLLSSTTTSPTTYTDLTVVNGATYLYYVQSVDASGNQSAPSNVYTATIP